MTNSPVVCRCSDQALYRDIVLAVVPHSVACSKQVNHFSVIPGAATWNSEITTTE